MADSPLLSLDYRVESQHQMQADAMVLEQDKQARALAIALQNPLPSYIVEAPAGSGKTELLTQRYLMLLQTVQHPEEVVAVTFTNKAASEMRQRIMNSLQQAHDNIPADKPHKEVTMQLAKAALKRSDLLAWDILKTPSRLRIYTIDALSGQLARQMPLMSRFGSQPEVLDEADGLYQQAASQTLALLDDPEHGDAVRTALSFFNNDSAQLTRLMAGMLEKRDQWLDYHASRIDISQVEQALAAMIEKDLQLAREVMSERIQKMLMPIARYAASNLPCEHAIALLRDWDYALSADIQSLALWQALVDLLCSKEDFRKRWDKKTGILPEDQGRVFKEQLADIVIMLQSDSAAATRLINLRSLPMPVFGEQGKAMIHSLNRLLMVSCAELWLLFQQQGKVDFVEVSQRAITALQDELGMPSELALRLDYQISHLLIDEFQDTSPTQIRLIEMLTRGWQSGDGHSLFLVGDPMQSIYRFRKANVGLFLKAQRQGIGHIALTPLKLSQNNRSEPSVVHWINQSFKQIFPQHDAIADGAIQYREFLPTKHDSDSNGVYVYPIYEQQSQTESLEDEEGEDLPVGAVRMREANQIIKIIRDTQAQRPQAKIAVLVRARSHLQVLVSQIRRHYPDLKFQAVEIEELTNRQVVQDLLSLCYALHHRADRVHWLAVLRAPWCGLSLQDLHHLIGEDRHSTVMQLMSNPQRVAELTDEGRKRLVYVRDILFMALQQQGRMSTSRWIRATWLMLNGPHCLWKEGDAADVEAFFERIDQIERAGRFSIQELQREVDKLYAQPDVHAPDTLQFMTIHKSKGLEFDSVILPGLDLASGRDESPLMRWEEVLEELPDGQIRRTDVVVAPLVPNSQRDSENDNKIYAYLKQFDKRRAHFEDMRVLYVAATRAERCLHLLAAIKQNSRGEINPKKGTFLAMLWPLLSAKFTQQNLLDASLSGDATVLQDERSLQDFVPQLIRLPALNLASEFAHFTPVIDLDSASRNPVLQIADSSDEEQQAAGLGISIGTLTHYYLQMIAEQGLAQWDTHQLDQFLPAMRAWLSRQRYSFEQAQQGAEAVLQMLRHALTMPQARWVLEAHDEAEAEYTLEQVLDDGQVKRWIIDRTFVVQGERWIIDYKTDRLATGQSPQQLAESYREQLENYARLFAHQSLPIRMGVLLLSVPEFVEL